MAIITVKGKDETELNVYESGISSVNDYTITVDGTKYNDADSYMLQSSSDEEMVYKFYIRGLSNGAHNIKLNIKSPCLLKLTFRKNELINLEQID